MEMSDAEVAVAAALRGAHVVARMYGDLHTRLTTAATDSATTADLAAEEVILGLLAELRPGDARIGEETGYSGSEGAERRWYVDPLCGTSNFAAGTPLLVVNVALLVGDRSLAAAAADPVARELFWTEGEHAFRRRDDADRELVPSSSSRLVEINCDGPLDQPFVGGQLVSDPRLHEMYSPRVISSTLGVAWVAAGRRAAYVSDGRFRENLHFAAGIALCEASGCTISDLDGNPLHTGRGLIISADEDTHDRMVSLVEPHLEHVRTTP